MKRIYYLFAVACLFAVTSCCTTRTTSITQTKMPVTRGIIADLDVRSEKITETYTVEVKNKLAVDEEELKANAVFDALKKVGADILVAPQFRINSERCNSRTYYNIVVSGYPAYYTNFRQMPAADRIELRELKEGASYVVVKKSVANNDLEYDKDIIVVPVRGGGNQTLDLNEVELERIVLNGNGKKIKTEDKRPAGKVGIASEESEDQPARKKKSGWNPFK